jgi:hypothetical protein
MFVSVPAFGILHCAASLYVDSLRLYHAIPSQSLTSVVLLFTAP